MKIVQSQLKDCALATANAANRLVDLFKKSADFIEDESAWLTMAAGNVSSYVGILNEGIRLADPIKVYQGVNLLTSMNKYILDVDLHNPNLENQIRKELGNIHAAAIPVIQASTNTIRRI